MADPTLYFWDPAREAAMIKTGPPRMAILGTHGIPARHGGFETFAEHLALYLVSRGWAVTVYCQEKGKGKVFEDQWKGVRLVRIPVRIPGPIGTMIFDWRSTLHAACEGDLILSLGYNTAIFCILYRLSGRTNLMNMDGLEWRRDKWSRPAKMWLYFNEWAGCRLADQLIADHPEIRNHLTRWVSERKIAMIPYGADTCEDADVNLLRTFGLKKKGYALVIARPEPENSLLEIVSAFSEKRRRYTLVILGNYRPYENPYHRKVMNAGSDEVLFLGAIYEKKVVAALRRYCRLYIHGHQVGGTNPSLVEALASASPVLAHANIFNRWVAGKQAAFFTDRETCGAALDRLLDDDVMLNAMSEASLLRYEEAFTWEKILPSYESLLLSMVTTHTKTV